MVTILRLLFLLFVLSPAVTKGTTSSPDYILPGGEIFPAQISGCDLDAPAAITVEDAGATYITISWTVVKHAYAYNVRVYDVSQGLPGQLVIDAKPIMGTHYTATNLTPGAKYRLEVAAMCEGENEPVSRRFTWIESLTLIIDLVADGYTALPSGLNPPYNCTCMDLGNAPNVYRWFDVVRITDGQMRFSRYQIWLELDTVLQQRRIRVKKIPEYYYPGQTWPSKPVDDQLEPPSQYFIGNVFVLDEGNQKIGRMDFDFDGQNYKACANAMSAGYSIRCIPPNPVYPPNPPGEIPDIRSSETLTEIPAKTTVSNPFSDFLRVTITAPLPETTTTFYLFDSNGRLVLEEQISAVQQYNLPTAHLAPGFYILKINANHASQTFKVIKF